VSHHLLLAHANAVKIYLEKFQKQQGGSNWHHSLGNWAEPWDPESQHDVRAAKNVLVFDVGRYADPVYLGDYLLEERSFR
jgi:beta-glucosidase/6-phospho-beta-glucosidase/beta-galactosidase